MHRVAIFAIREHKLALKKYLKPNKREKAEHQGSDLLLQHGLPLSQPVSYGKPLNGALDLRPPLPHVVLDVKHKGLLPKVGIHDLSWSLETHCRVEVWLGRKKNKPVLTTAFSFCFQLGGLVKPKSCSLHWHKCNETGRGNSPLGISQGIPWLAVHLWKVIASNQNNGLNSPAAWDGGHDCCLWMDASGSVFCNFYQEPADNITKTTSIMAK